MKKYIIPSILLFTMVWRAPFSQNIRLNFEDAFIIGCAGALAFYIAQKVNLWVGLFLGIATISAYFPFVTDESTEAIFFITFGVVWYMVCVHYFKNGTERVYDAICIIALFNVLFLVLQILGIDPIHAAIDPLKKFRVGLMSCNDGLSAMLAICFPAFLRKKWCWFIPVIVFGLIGVQTFAGPLAVSVGLIFYAFCKVRSPYHVAGIVLLCVAGLYFYTLIDGPDTNWRLATWKMAMFNLYPQHWILGSGLGHWKIVFANPEIAQKMLSLPNYFMRIMAQAHNEFIQGVFEMGVGFIVIVSGYFVNVFRRYGKEALLPVMALICISVDSTAFFPFHIGILAFISIAWLADLEVKLAKNN